VDGGAFVADGDGGPSLNDREEMSRERREARARPRACPACGSPRVATILYGMPDLSKKFIEDRDARRIVLGGCCVTGDDPVWRCVDCGQPVHRSQSSKPR